MSDCQCYLSLRDNMLQRYPSTDLILKARVLVKPSWPAHPLRRDLYGENRGSVFVHRIQDRPHFSSYYFRFGIVQENLYCWQTMAVMNVLIVLLVLSADFERGCSQMKLQHTSGRNRLEIKTVNELMIVSINGPALAT